MAATAKILQWSFRRVTPLLVPALVVREKLQKVLPYVSWTAAVAKAKMTAMELDEAGNLTVDLSQQYVGFIRLYLSKEGYMERRTWCVDIWHNVHFQGIWDSVPNLKEARHVRFQALRYARSGGSSTKVGTYLKIIGVYHY